METTQNGNPAGSLKILIAEDEELNRMLVQKLFERNQISPDFAENGQEAVEKFKAAQEGANETSQNGGYHLVLLDHQMPLMDGYEAASQIRALNPKTPILGLTADDPESTKERALESGMNGVIAKPLNATTLGQIIEAAKTGDAGGF